MLFNGVLSPKLLNNPFPFRSLANLDTTTHSTF